MQVFKFPLNMDFLGQVTKQLSRWSKYLVLRDLKIVATSIFVIIFVNWWLITNWKDKFICGVFINTYAKLLEKAMAPHSSTLAWKIPRTEEPGGPQSIGSPTHSSVLAWRIPGMGEPGGLPSMESHRVGHDWSDLAAAAAISELNIKISMILNLFIFFSLRMSVL